MKLKGILYIIIGLMSASFAWLILTVVTADSGHFPLYFVVHALAATFTGPYIFVFSGLIIAALVILFIVLRVKDKATKQSADLANQDQTIPKSVLFASSTIIVFLSVGMFACFGVSYMLYEWSTLGGFHWRYLLSFDSFEFWSAFFFAIGLLQATMTLFLIRKLPRKDNKPGSNSDEITS